MAVLKEEVNMFSGLIQHVGEITANRGAALEISVPLKAVKKGESVAINGVCLTAVRIRKVGRASRLGFDVSTETMARTTLRNLQRGAAVNVERALTVADSLGGHIVQGHVDGVGRVIRIEGAPENKTFWFEGPVGFEKYLVEKGSVAVDGISLTVASLAGRQFSVAVIPFTLEHTNLRFLSEGNLVNLEADVIAKYVLKYTKGS
jgi:riboflavin synthase